MLKTNFRHVLKFCWNRYSEVKMKRNSAKRTIGRSRKDFDLLSENISENNECS